MAEPLPRPAFLSPVAAAPLVPGALAAPAPTPAARTPGRGGVVFLLPRRATHSDVFHMPTAPFQLPSACFFRTRSTFARMRFSTPPVDST
jgi:hypothetical protein